ncbi:MAG: sulfur oxidation c-type cytochrome SoxX [Rhodospirillales bacterium]|nr:sulfur oxidation c-type cytochrome SoxX [Rhodospirillales bacterium]
MSRKTRILVLALLLGLVGPTSAWAQQNLVAYAIVKDGIPQSLTGKPGDPARGRKLFAQTTKGNCLSCHQAPIPEELFHGKIGPELDEVGARLTAAEMRLRIVDPKVLNPDTMMPAFYKINGLNRVMKAWEGKAILAADEVEDIIAYLQTLK